MHGLQSTEKAPRALPQHGGSSCASPCSYHNTTFDAWFGGPHNRICFLINNDRSLLYPGIIHIYIHTHHTHKEKGRPQNILNIIKAISWNALGHVQWGDVNLPLEPPRRIFA